MADNVVFNNLERQLNFIGGGLDGIANDQLTPDVAALTDGGYAVAYQSSNGGDTDIYYQLLGASGAPIGPTLGFARSDDQSLPSIAGRADDGFVGAYQGGSGANSQLFVDNFGPGGSTPATVF